jgi:hypothetical protein
MSILWAIIATAFLIIPGMAIWFAWLRLRKQDESHVSKPWNILNYATLAFVTAADLYFVSAIVLAFTLWSESFEKWAFYRNENSIFTTSILSALVCGLCVRFGRGVGRKEIARAALLFALLTFIFILIVLPT